MTRSAVGTTLIAGAFALVVGCNGGSSNSNEPAAAGTIKAETGGTVSLAGGPTVQIPPGALATDTVITVQQLLMQAPSGAVTPVYEFGPSGTIFSQPVTVTFPVPSGTTAAAVWTKRDGAAEYASVPTTITGGTASALVNHFSIFLLGPVDFTGTWAGPVYTIINGNGTAGTAGVTVQRRNVVQNVGEVRWTLSGSTSTICNGTVAGDVLIAMCTITSNDKTCSATYQPGGTISGTTWNISDSFTWEGNSCANAGMTITVPGSTLEKQSDPTALFCFETFPSQANGAFTSNVNSAVPDFVDIVGGDVAVDSTSISAQMTLRALPPSLTFNQQGVPLNAREYSWAVEFDVNGDNLTDYSLMVAHFKFLNTPTSGALLTNTQEDAWKASGTGMQRLVSVSSSLADDTIYLSVPKSAHADLANITPSAKVRFTTSYVGSISAAYGDCAP